MPIYARGICRIHYARFIRKNPNHSNIIASNTSGYRGVTWKEKHRRWVAHINPGGKIIYLGEFKSKEMAARAYDAAARERYGTSAKLNFPNEQQAVVRDQRKTADKVSGVSGVNWDKSIARWRVRITRHGQRIFSGCFLTMEEAIVARAAVMNEVTDYQYP